MVLALLLGKTPYFTAVPTETTNAVPAVMVAPIAAKPDPFAQFRDAHLIPISSTIVIKDRVFIEVQEEKQ